MFILLACPTNQTDHPTTPHPKLHPPRSSLVAHTHDNDAEYQPQSPHLISVAMKGRRGCALHVLADVGGALHKALCVAHPTDVDAGRGAGQGGGIYIYKRKKLEIEMRLKKRR